MGVWAAVHWCESEDVVGAGEVFVSDHILHRENMLCQPLEGKSAGEGMAYTTESQQGTTSTRKFVVFTRHTVEIRGADVLGIEIIIDLRADLMWSAADLPSWEGKRKICGGEAGFVAHLNRLSIPSGVRLLSILLVQRDGDYPVGNLI